MFAPWIPVSLLALAAPQASVDVRHYTLDVQLAGEHLTGRVVLAADCPEPVESWALELGGGMTVVAAASGGEPVPFERSGAELRLDVSAVARGGDFAVELEFEGRPYNRQSEEVGGFVRTVVSEEIAYIRSQYAWYPRAADDFATYSMTVNARADWLVRTAGTELARAEEEGRRVWRFEASAPVPDVGLAAGPWVELAPKTVGGLAVDAYVFPHHLQGAEYLVGVAGRAGAHYAQRFGDIEADRFTLVEMPDAFGAQSGYSEAGYFLIGGGTFEMAMSGVGGEELVAHEAAHNWWGGEVGFSDFANESLASWSALGFVEEELGASAARQSRSVAVEAVAAAAADGAEVDLADITGWGGGMDARTYRVHAYDKGMMVLAMVEQAVGRKALDRALGRFVKEHHGTNVGYAELRAALLGSGRKAAPVVEQWELAGLPSLAIEHEAKKAGSRVKITGTVVRADDGRPFVLEVPVLAICGAEDVEEVVELDGARGSFKMTLPSAPDALVIDPDYRLLAARRSFTGVDPDAVVKEAFQVANDPSIGSPPECEATIAKLKGLLRVGAGELEGLCHTGIGRCQFRLGNFDEARREFQAALRLGAGGPFLRSWIQLRLGCMADLAGDRETALEHYERAQDDGASKFVADLATRFAKEPYRGHAKDG